MKARILVIVVMVAMLCIAGCGGDPLANFAAGFGSGVVVAVNKANVAVEELNENIAAVNEASAELEALLENDPMLLVNTLDPNLSNTLDQFMVNLKALEARAEEFKDEKGKIDWERIISVLAIGVLGGGSGVNIFKNRKVAK